MREGNQLVVPSKEIGGLFRQLGGEASFHVQFGVQEGEVVEGELLQRTLAHATEPRSQSEALQEKKVASYLYKRKVGVEFEAKPLKLKDDIVGHGQLLLQSLHKGREGRTVQLWPILEHH